MPRDDLTRARRARTFRYAISSLGSHRARTYVRYPSRRYAPDEHRCGALKFPSRQTDYKGNREKKRPVSYAGRAAARLETDVVI